MGTLYLESCCDTDSCSRSVSVESFVVLHAIKCLDLQNDSTDISVVFVETDFDFCESRVPVNFHLVSHSVRKQSDQSLANEAKICKLPVFVAKQNGLLKIVAGLSSVLRQLLYLKSVDHPLLGFRQSCLIACAEVSVWTRFCEVDVIKSVKSVLLDSKSRMTCIPRDVARLEEHLSRAPRLHNARKHRQAYAKAIGSNESEEELPHLFAEGPSMTLADIMLFPCFYILLSGFAPDALEEALPLVFSWYARLLTCDQLQQGLEMLTSLLPMLPSQNLHAGDAYVVPQVPRESLYKSDPSRYKPRSNKMFTHQEDVEASLAIVDNLSTEHEITQLMKPYGADQDFEWQNIPPEIHPEGGHVPHKRQLRKAEQLENMTKAVMKLAKPGHILVDFCSGSGHLGLLLAWVLPSCTVLLLENKDISLQRAADRVRKLGLSNVQLVQSNIDYFQGKFDIGIALHACGVATDLVLQICEAKRAAFVVCPCCYGSIQSGHTVTYPRSKLFKSSILEPKDYLVLGHCADQTHGEEGLKTAQGNLCMAAIDTDRLLHSLESGYEVHLSKMKPQTCSPKNNLLVGTPKERVDMKFIYRR